jgi:hypothetical protein
MTMVNVELTIRGMIALFFEKNGEGQVVACQAGVLKDAPGHHFDLKVFRKGVPPIPIPTGPVKPALKLEVSPDPVISFEEGEINRHDGTGASKSFQWILDFERDVYTIPIGSSEQAFQSILHINGGKFSTEDKSRNGLIFFDEAAGNCTNIGIVGTVVGLQIELAEGQTARFLNDGSPVFTATPADQIAIKLFNERPHAHGGPPIQHHGDANFFYSAVGHKIPPGQRKVFSSTPFPPEALVVPVTPEASCLVPTGGRGPIEQP